MDGRIVSNFFKHNKVSLPPKQIGSEFDAIGYLYKILALNQSDIKNETHYDTKKDNLLNRSIKIKQTDNKKICGPTCSHILRKSKIREWK